MDVKYFRNITSGPGPSLFSWGWLPHSYTEWTETIRNLPVSVFVVHKPRDEPALKYECRSIINLSQGTMGTATLRFFFNYEIVHVHEAESNAVRGSSTSVAGVQGIQIRSLLGPPIMTCDARDESTHMFPVLARDLMSCPTQLD